MRHARVRKQGRLRVWRAQTPQRGHRPRLLLRTAKLCGAKWCGGSLPTLLCCCVSQGADLDEVMSVVGSDSRIGAGYLKACPGMGSASPLAKRPRPLSHLLRARASASSARLPVGARACCTEGVSLPSLCANFAQGADLTCDGRCGWLGRGPTLMTNLSMLVYICESMKLHDVAEYWQHVSSLRHRNSVLDSLRPPVFSALWLGAGTYLQQHTAWVRAPPWGPAADAVTQL